MRKHQLSFAAVALSLGLVFAIGGAASAHGHNGHNGHGNNGGGYGYGHGHGHSGSVTGFTTCNIHGRLTISATGSVTISGNITPKHGHACTGDTKLKTGRFSTSLTSSPAATTTLASCPPSSTVYLSDVTGGTIAWSPRAKVSPSVGVALTGGTLSQVTVDGNQFYEIAYTGASVLSGSFATTSGSFATISAVSLTAWSNQTVSELTECRANGSLSFAFQGTLAL